MEIVKLKDITKEFKKAGRKVLALNKVGFTIGQKEAIGLLGPNGAGKTTLLRILYYMLEADRGEVIYNNKNIINTPELRKVFSFPFLLKYERLPVNLVIKLTAEFHGIKLREKDIDELLEKYLLLEEKYTQVQKLSTGNFAKLMLLSTEFQQGNILLLDEITNGLDLFAVEHLLDILRRRVKEGYSILFSSHIFSHIEKLCERVIIIYKGHILADGTISELKSSIKNKIFVDVYFNYPVNYIVDKLNKLDISYEILSDYKIKFIIDDETFDRLEILLNEAGIAKYVESISKRNIGLEEIYSYYISRFKSKEKNGAPKN